MNIKFNTWYYAPKSQYMEHFIYAIEKEGQWYKGIRIIPETKRISNSFMLHSLDYYELTTETEKLLKNIKAKLL